MTEAPREAIATVESLPPERQDAVAAAMLEAIEEQEWAEPLAHAGSASLLQRLVIEALAEDAAGLAKDATEGWCERRARLAA